MPNDAATADAFHPAMQGTGLVPMPSEDPIMAEARIGFDRLRGMSHDELREVIRSRVRLLDSVLREREHRKAALETARLASKLLDLKRARSQRIHRRVNIGSACAAVASTLLIVVAMA